MLPKVLSCSSFLRELNIVAVCDSADPPSLMQGQNCGSDSETPSSASPFRRLSASGPGPFYLSLCVCMIQGDVGTS